AKASAMLAKTTVSHSHTAITNVYQDGSLPPSAAPPSSWMNEVAVVMTAPISTTNITGLRTCTRGSSLIRLSMSARLTMSGRNNEIARRSDRCTGLGAGGVATDISDRPVGRARG